MDSFYKRINILIKLKISSAQRQYLVPYFIDATLRPRCFMWLHQTLYVKDDRFKAKDYKIDRMLELY